LALFCNSIFLTEAAQYECSYRRTAHHATAPDQTRRSCLCRIRRCELSRPDKCAFCVGVRPAVALRRPTHSDTDQSRNAAVWRSIRLNSQRRARHDKTVLSVSCLAWRCELALVPNQSWVNLNDTNRRVIHTGMRQGLRNGTVSICPSVPYSSRPSMRACSGAAGRRY